MDHYFLTLIIGGGPLCAFQRLEAKHHEALSNFGYNFKLRRYTTERLYLTFVNIFCVFVNAMIIGGVVSIIEAITTRKKAGLSGKP
jgi:hypothetical protein